MFRRVLLVLASLLAACVPAPGERSSRSASAAIDSIVELTLSGDPTPAISIAVVHGGDTLALKGYGIADLEHHTPVTDQTVFHIGSVTKPFTAAAIMKLVEDGRLHLESTLGEVLPEYSGPGRSATIHQLLNHTSGIPSYTRPESAYRQLRDRALAYEEILALFAQEPLEFEHGSSFAYNNSGYYLLGKIIERVTGESYAEHLARTQFRPLQLEYTHHCHHENAGLSHAKSYELRMGRPAPAAPEALENAGAAGALCSTPRDLVRWARALVSGQLVSTPSYQRMTTPAPGRDARQRYGYGLMGSELEGHAWIGHTGGFAGFRAVITHYPEADLTIAVLANGPAPVWNVEREIARHVLGIAESR